MSLISTMNKKSRLGHPWYIVLSFLRRRQTTGSVSFYKYPFIFFTQFSIAGDRELVSITNSCCVRGVEHSGQVQVHHRSKRQTTIHPLN